MGAPGDRQRPVHGSVLSGVGEGESRMISSMPLQASVVTSAVSRAFPLPRRSGVGVAVRVDLVGRHAEQRGHLLGDHLPHDLGEVGVVVRTALIGLR